MFSAPQIRLLPDGKRLHLNHGPIDLVVEAFGEPAEIAASYRQAAARFPDILPALVSELDGLRQPIAAPRWQPDGPVARRMVAACRPHGNVFVTPMAAVAGAVADEMMEALVAGRRLRRAYVNNGGDIALHLAPGESLTAGLVTDYHLPAIDATCSLTAAMPVRGLATSGWKGRSHSLGIADSVTVLAHDAASADVAATLIANAVDADHPAIERSPARALDPDSDLGPRPVTVAVGSLDAATVAHALDAGAAAAQAAERAGHITAAVLVLQRQYRVVGAVPPGLVAAQVAETAA
jgi:uncharacterized protein